MSKYKVLLSLAISVFVTSENYAQFFPDNIRTDSDAVHFIKEQNNAKSDPQWNHFYLTDGSEWKDYVNLDKQSEDAAAAQISPKAWAVTDLNGDGKKDFIVSGYLAKTQNDRTTADYKILIFLTGPKKNKYDIISLLPNYAHAAPAYFSLLTLGGKQYTIVNDFNKKSADARSPYKTDTLQYNDFVQNFTDYAQTYYPSEVQKIEYTVNEDEQGSYHNVTLQETAGKYFIIFSFKNAQSGRPSSHTLRVRKEYFQQPDSLARSLNFPAGSVTIDNDQNPDALPVKTMIYYKDGTKTEINDYDGNGNYTLSAIYQTMEDALKMASQKLQNRAQFWGNFVGGISIGL